MGTRLEGKVAIVTGGSNGLGEAIVRRFVDEGARVVIGDIDVDAGERLATELGEVCDFVQLDVGDEAPKPQNPFKSETIIITDRP